MLLPLYNDAAKQPVKRGSDGHAGLWFDKFCHEWRDNHHSWTMSGGSDKDNPKVNWIKTLADGGTVGVRSQIEECVVRSARLIERRRGRFAVFTTGSRFVTGLGRSHPVENGFAWHPTLGTPCLPGSSIKGLVRSWAKMEAEPLPDGKIFERLFGGPGKEGAICFLDALPVAPARLEADVMTPHHAGWSEKDLPGDWRSPNPIPFLTTAAGTPFLFGIIPCRVVEDGDLKRVFGWLCDSLVYAGGGAKTAIGYGRFRHDEERTSNWTRRLKDEERQRHDQQARQEMMKTPGGRWRLKLEGLAEAEILDLVRIHLEKEPLEDPRERAAFVQAVLSMDLVQHWRRGNTRDPRTGVGKKKLRERARLLGSVRTGNESDSL